MGGVAAIFVSRASHGEWAPAADRRDPIEVLLASERGSAGGAGADPLRSDGGEPVHVLAGVGGGDGGRSGGGADDGACRCRRAVIVICMNFGLFATPERNVVFGLNDFDETMPGPWEWDLKRLVASFVVAARDVRLDDDQAVEAAADRGRGRIGSGCGSSPR